MSEIGAEQSLLPLPTVLWALFDIKMRPQLSHLFYPNSTGQLSLPIICPIDCDLLTLNTNFKGNLEVLVSI